MDAAVFASTANVIIGIRGNRLFQCNASTGAIQNQVDVGTFGRNGCVAYDIGSNKIFAAAWNTPHYDIQTVGGFQTSVSNRNLYRINPATLAVELTADITTTFGLTNVLGHANDMTAQEAGICAMDAAGGKVYFRWWGCWINGLISGGSIQATINPANGSITGFVNGAEGVTGGYPNLVYGSVSGHDNAIFCDQQGTQEIILSDYTATVENTFPTSNKNILAVGFAPTQQRVLITDVAEAIYVYSAVGASLGTIHTGHASFNGLSVRRNQTTGLIYVPGGSDNSVAVIDPSSGAFGALSGAIRTGFDAPVDIVPAGTLTFAVQAGSVPLKLIV